jgi:hypothetical protein
MDGRFDGIDSRLDAMDARLDGIDARLTGHDGQFISILGRMDTLSVELRTLIDERWNHTRVLFEEVIQRIAAIGEAQGSSVTPPGRKRRGKRG